MSGFEMTMPLLGLLTGRSLGRVVGGWADWLAFAILVALGLYMVIGSERAESDRVTSFASAEGVAMIALGAAVSLDDGGRRGDRPHLSRRSRPTRCSLSLSSRRQPSCRRRLKRSWRTCQRAGASRPTPEPRVCRRSCNAHRRSSHRPPSPVRSRGRRSRLGACRRSRRAGRPPAPGPSRAWR